MKKCSACSVFASTVTIVFALAATASAALTYSAQSGAWSDTGTWTGGIVPNTSSFTSSTRRDKFQTILQYNPVNLLNLSNKQVKQTLTAGQDLTFTTACNIRANVYSSTAGDNDNFAFTAAYKLKLSSPVTLRIEDCDADGYALPGVVADYLNKKYTLVTYTTATNFSNIVPTLASVTWKIGGKDYAVTFQNDLATDGSVTVSGLTDLSPVRKETCILLR